MTFHEAIENVGKAVDVAGVATLVVGILVATWTAARSPSTSTLDRGRFFDCGHSSGAMMSFRLAGEESELFAAVGIVAGICAKGW